MLKFPVVTLAALLFAVPATITLAVTAPPATDKNATATTAPAAPAKGDVKQEIGELIGKIQAKIEDGKRAEKDYAPELKRFDALLAEHKGEKTNEVAYILFMKAQLYTQIFDDSLAAVKLFRQVKEEFPDTDPGMNVDRQIAMIEQMEPLKKIQ